MAKESEKISKYKLTVILLLVLILVGQFWFLFNCCPQRSPIYDLTKIVLDSEEDPIEGVTVELWHRGSKIREGVTDSQGKVVFDNLSSGLYTIKVPEFDMTERVFLNKDKTVTNRLSEGKGRWGQENKSSNSKGGHRP